MWLCSTLPVAICTTSTWLTELLAAQVWTASSLPSGLTAVHHTGSANRSVRVTRPVAASQKVTRRLTPPVTSVRPSGVNAIAADVGAVAGRQRAHQPQRPQVDERDRSVALVARHQRRIAD